MQKLKEKKKQNEPSQLNATMFRRIMLPVQTIPNHERHQIKCLTKYSIRPKLLVVLAFLDTLILLCT
jgi:hypothetical protein